MRGTSVLSAAPFQLNWYHYNATWVTNLLFPNCDWKPQTYWYTFNFVARHFDKCLKRVLKKPTAVHTEVRSSPREAQNQQSWLKRQLYCSLTLSLLLSAIFLFATKDSMPGAFFYAFVSAFKIVFLYFLFWTIILHT